MPKIILHLCADLGSDSYPYQIDPAYEVIKIGKDVGVENYHPPKANTWGEGRVQGIIANPPCTEFSTAKGFHRKSQAVFGVELLNHCRRIIFEACPVWFVIENPATGTMADYMGKSAHTYQPWEYGSPWTKKTALWGRFTMPLAKYQSWEDVPKNPYLYTRPGRPKPSLAFLHKSAIDDIQEFQPFRDSVKTDADLRSLCSQGFAKAFKEANP